MPGTVFSAPGELAKVADQHGLVIIGGVFPELVSFRTFEQKAIGRA